MTGTLDRPQAYAIDFGTSNSLLAAAGSGKLFPPIPLDSQAPDATILRSVLFFPNMRTCFYGLSAIEEFKRHDLEGRLIRSIKKYLPIRSFVGTWVEDRPMNLEDIIGTFLREMKRRADLHFQANITTVVLGRPARFADDDSDDQYAQYRLERAARVAGFKEIAFVPEPVAAAFELKAELDRPKIVLVGDFGGGTSDFTVIRVGKETFKKSDVLSIGGVSLAGDAMDGMMMRRRLLTYFGSDVSYVVPFGSNVLRMPTYLIDKLCSPADVVLLRKRDTLEFFRNVQQWSLTGADRYKMDRLFCVIEDNLGFDIFESIERAKRHLSDEEVSSLCFEYPGIQIREEVKREEFESYIAEISEKILASLDETLKCAQISSEEIDLVYCTGGTAKVPLIHRELVRRFGRERVQTRAHFHAVVQGLSVRAQEMLSR